MNDLSRLPEKLVLGLLQIRSLPGDNDANIQANMNEMERMADEAVRQGAELLVLPEYWPFGFQTRERLMEIAESIPGGRLSAFLRDLAQRHKIYIAGGTVCERDDQGRLFNTTLFLGPDGQILYKHSKANLYSQLGEDTIFTPGGEFGVIETPLGTVGMMICYEGDFPETSRVLKLMGAQLILHVSAYESPMEHWWQTFYNAHALTNAVWLAQVNLAGKYEWLGSPVHCFGMSRVVAPTGELVAHGTHYPMETPVEQMKSEILLARLDYRKGLELGRVGQECLTVDRRPDLYGRLVS